MDTGAPGRGLVMVQGLLGALRQLPPTYKDGIQSFSDNKERLFPCLPSCVFVF